MKWWARPAELTNKENKAGFKVRKIEAETPGGGLWGRMQEGAQRSQGSVIGGVTVRPGRQTGAGEPEHREALVVPVCCGALQGQLQLRRSMSGRQRRHLEREQAQVPQYFFGGAAAGHERSDFASSAAGALPDVDAPNPSVERGPVEPGLLRLHRGGAGDAGVGITMARAAAWDERRGRALEYGLLGRHQALLQLKERHWRPSDYFKFFETASRA